MVVGNQRSQCPVQSEVTISHPIKSHNSLSNHKSSAIVLSEITYFNLPLIIIVHFLDCYPLEIILHPGVSQIRVKSEKHKIAYEKINLSYTRITNYCPVIHLKYFIYS
jgi:hypothetical protein